MKGKSSKTSVRYKDTPGRCYFCGREIEQKPGRGRPQIAHKNCTIIASRIGEIARLLYEVDFESEEQLKLVRGDFMSNIINGPLHMGSARKKISERKSHE